MVQRANERVRAAMHEVEARMEAERAALREEAATMARAAAAAAEDRGIATAASRCTSGSLPSPCCVFHSYITHLPLSP